MVELLFFIVGCFFVSLQSHFIFGGDSAEYSTVARTWGIAHPPGYPLYSFLCNIFDRVIPFQTTSWKISLLSSIPTILTAYLIYRILRHVMIENKVAFLSSLLYLFLFPVWQYGLVPEVFALHTLLVSAITYLLLLYVKKPKTALLFWTCALLGLCISNHHIFVLFVPGWLLLMKNKIKKIVANKWVCLRMILFLLLGASVYGYAVYASFRNTILDWENARTIQGLFSLITRSAYGSFKAYAGSNANIVNQLSDIVSGCVFIFLDFKFIGILFICLGLITIRSYSKPLALFLYTSLITHFIFLFYTNFVLTAANVSGMYERFLIPLYLLLTLSLGIGVDYFYHNFYLKICAQINNPLLKKIVSYIYFLFILLLIFIIGKQNFKTISFIPHINTFEQFGKDIIATVPQNGILTTKGDTPTFTSMYQVYGLQKRKDIVFFQLGLMGKENYIQQLKKRTPQLIINNPIKKEEDFKKFISTNAPQRGYYAEQEMSMGTWRPYGLLWKYYPDNLAASSDSANVLAANNYLWNNQYRMPVLSGDQKNIFHLNSVFEYYLNAYRNYAKLLVYLNRYNEAELVLQNIAEHFQNNDANSEVALLNILVVEKKCTKASAIAKKIDISKTINKYPGFIFPALNYLQVCEPNNPLILEYRKKAVDFEKSTKTNLNSF